jgi:multiple sugar transport system permease protein
LTNTLLYVAITVPGSVLLGLRAALLIEATGAFAPLQGDLAPAGNGDADRHVDRVGVIRFTAVRHRQPARQGLGLARIDWLQDQSVRCSLCVASASGNLGFNMVLFMAGLSPISRDLYEAAAVDRADRLSTASDW